MKSSKEKIRVVVDTKVVCDLFQLLNPEYDPTGIIHEKLANHDLHHEDFANTSEEELPPILKSKHLGKYSKNTGRYWNLELIYECLNFVKSGEMELCITPTVFYELPNEIYDVVKDYIINLTVKNEDAEYFADRVGFLANVYALRGIMKREIDEYGNSRLGLANIKLAEASNFGLFFLTTNAKKYIHQDIYKQDFKIANEIAEINKYYKLYQVSNTGYITAPQPIEFSRFMARMYRHLQGEDVKSLYLASNNINENNEYTYFKR